MDATEANVSSECVNYAVPNGPGNQLAETAVYVHPTTSPRLKSGRGLLAAYPQCKKADKPNGKKFHDSVKQPSSSGHLGVQAPDPPVATGVSKCYVFKSRLQEYAQKAGVSTPTYETFREGPSHMPLFQSAVIFGGVRYESLPGFYNRKAAEQSAAEVALMDLSAAKTKESFFLPLHETGLCKNVLQEYAQKMNYAIPTYTCKTQGPEGPDGPDRTQVYSCTVDIGGIQYIGATSRSKKDAEVKAARTALLAIRSTGNVDGDLGKNNLTVFPCKRKVPEPDPSIIETSNPKKSVKRRPKKKPRKHIQCGFRGNGNVTQPLQKRVCVDNNTGTPVTDQDVANNGQSVNCLESSAVVNASANAISHIAAVTDANTSPLINDRGAEQLDIANSDSTIGPENPACGSGI